MDLLDGTPPKRWGAEARRKIQLELREKYVAASNAIPGTKANWVYRARSGKFVSAVAYIKACMRLSDEGAPDELVLDLAHVAVRHVAEHLANRQKKAA